MDTEWIWVWRGLYVASFILILNGGTELIGGLIKEIGNEWECKKYATAFLRIGTGILFLIVAAAFITCSR